MKFSMTFLFLFLLTQGMLFTQTSLGELTYSTNPFYPPYDWGTPDGTFEGATMEIFRLVIPEGIKTKAIFVPWKRAQDMARTGEIDLLLSLRITPERSEYLSFTTHRAFPNPIVVFVKKDSGILMNAWIDLKAFRGGVSSGDTFGNGFDEYWPSQLTIETAKSMVENFKKLDLGRIDYFVTGKFMGEAYLASIKSTTISTLEKPISNGDIHFGFSKKSPFISILPQISSRLKELDKDGLLELILKKNLDKFYENDPPFIFPTQ